MTTKLPSLNNSFHNNNSKSNTNNQKQKIKQLQNNLFSKLDSYD